MEPFAQRELVRARVRAVDAIVCAHGRDDSGVHSILEGPEIQLMRGATVGRTISTVWTLHVDRVSISPVVNNRVDERPSVFLLVADEMPHHRHDVLGLDSAR
jgi:hypothetical protein